MNHSTLSQLLRGKRQFPARTIKVLGKRLGLAETAIEGFIIHERRFPANHSMREIDVQHQILELVTLESFKADVGWIARVLGITTDAVHVGLAQLLAMGLMRMEDTNRWVVKEQIGESMAASGLAPEAGHSMVQLFIEVADVPAYVEKAARLGATVLIPPQKLPDGGQLAIMLDPVGISFGLFKPRA